MNVKERGNEEKLYRIIRNLDRQGILRLLDLDNLSPSEFANLVGIDSSTISRWLSEKASPHDGSIEKIIKTYGARILQDKYFNIASNRF